MNKYTFTRILCIVLIAAGFVIVCTGALGYAFNICYFCALPLLIAGSGWVEYLEELK